MNFPRSTPRYKFLAFNFFQTPDVFRRRLWDTVWVFLDQYRFLEFKVVPFHKSFLGDFYKDKVSFPIISGPNSRSRHLNRRRLEFWKLCSDVRISPHHKPLNEASLVQMVMWQCDILSDSGKDTWWFIASILHCCQVDQMGHLTRCNIVHHCMLLSLFRSLQWKKRLTDALALYLNSAGSQR